MRVWGHTIWMGGQRTFLSLAVLAREHSDHIKRLFGGSPLTSFPPPRGPLLSAAP